ncbi:methionine--tRNA ligase subunit beta [candidate division WWE3 bacterium]|nr:methionine--tRNA ligase subunit beta [candidate division WWE3 bacterium]
MQEIKPTIKYDDFAKIDVRVVKVLEASFIEGSEKLLKLEVEMAGEKRQILSGIKKWYNPEDLVGRKVLIVANLETRKMMGLESRGMILAVESSAQEKPVLLELGEEVNTGDFLR